MRDGLLPTEDPLVSLEVFEGPLDLLLHLVRMNEVNILDLPMGLVTRQYLATLRAMGKMELPVAGEYFVMAAELLKIKSHMLLPRSGRPAPLSPEDTGLHTGRDPRAELVRQLLEYQELKKSSALLEAQIETQALSYACLQPPHEEHRPLQPLDRFALMGSYAGLLQRLFQRVAMGEITLDPHTVAQAIETILGELKHSPQRSFSQLLQGGPQAVSWMAAMFVALLELTRLGEITLRQDEHLCEIFLQSAKPAEALA